jgi:hypothetical protein
MLSADHWCGALAVGLIRNHTLVTKCLLLLSQVPLCGVMVAVVKLAMLDST